VHITLAVQQVTQNMRVVLTTLATDVCLHVHNRQVAVARLVGGIMGGMAPVMMTYDTYTSTILVHHACVF
jgi:hypothetical protein